MVGRVSIEKSKVLGIILGVAALVVLAGCSGTSDESRGSNAAAQTRDFYVVNGELAFNETALGIPHDTFAPATLVVNQGDTVKIHAYNGEADTPHTFTMDDFSINQEIPLQGHVDIQFVASQAGIYSYKCTYHLPTMVGQLVVLD